MEPKADTPPPPKGLDPELILEQQTKIISTIQDDTTFEILMHLIINQEMSLSEITTAIQKSKPTIHRHVQKLLEANLIEESREEKVRGHIQAKYYKPKSEGFQNGGFSSLNEILSMKQEQKAQVMKLMNLAMKSSITFYNKGLTELTNHLDRMNLEDFDAFLQNPDIHLNLSFLTESQFHQYLELYRDFATKFVKIFLEENQKEPDTPKPYLLFTSLIPIKKIFDQKHKI